MGYDRRIPAKALSSRGGRQRRAGFTLPELMIFLALATLVVGALYGMLRAQRQAYTHERAAIGRQDALRLAAAVLSADLMEASSAEGDLGALGSDSIAVRSPVGLGLVCAADSAKRILGLFDLAGRLSDSAGDSLLVYHPNGWLVREVVKLSPGGASGLTCPYGASGPSIQQTVRLDGSVSGVPVGAPVRAFHRYVYRLVQEGDSWWLGRNHATGSDILAGPFSADSSGLTFAYLDSAAKPTTDPSAVARIVFRLVAENRGSLKRDTLTATVRLRN